MCGNMTCPTAFRQPLSCYALWVFMLGPILAVFVGIYSEAWVAAPPLSGRWGRVGRRWRRPSSAFRNECDRRPPPSKLAMPRSIDGDGVDGAGGRTLPSPPPEGAPGGTEAASVFKPDGQRKLSWRDQFASLRNDVADPWIARSPSRSPPRPASLPPPTDKNDNNTEEQAAPYNEGAADGASSLTATATSSATDQERAPTSKPAPPSPPPRPPRPEVSAAEEAADVMRSRGESDTAAAQRAYLLLDAELAAAREKSGSLPSSSPSPSESVAALSRATAEALLSWIRSSTAGNGLVVLDDGQVGTSDTEERRALWAEHAPRVLELLKAVGEEPSSDPELQQIYTEAVMYSVASQGIIEAFVSGKALVFTSAMTVLVKKFPSQDNGVAFVFQGSYFLAAPWPVRSPRKALACYEKAVQVNERSRRNVYYVGLGRLACGDRGGAREMFSRAVSDELCESASPTERDIAGSLREQAQKGLGVCG